MKVKDAIKLLLEQDPEAELIANDGDLTWDYTEFDIMDIRPSQTRPTAVIVEVRERQFTGCAECGAEEELFQVKRDLEEDREDYCRACYKEYCGKEPEAV